MSKTENIHPSGLSQVRLGRLSSVLHGYVERGDACDNSRMFAQLTETALQFRGISYAQFEIDGQPLRQLLLGRAAPARF